MRILLFSALGLLGCKKDTPERGSSGGSEDGKVPIQPNPGSNSANADLSNTVSIDPKPLPSAAAAKPVTHVETKAVSNVAWDVDIKAVEHKGNDLANATEEDEQISANPGGVQITSESERVPQTVTVETKIEPKAFGVPFKGNLELAKKAQEIWRQISEETHEAWKIDPKTCLDHESSVTIEGDRVSLPYRLNSIFSTPGIGVETLAKDR
jgi:hypothetical protein